jgi:hypothetical protein
MLVLGAKMNTRVRDETATPLQGIGHSTVGTVFQLQRTGNEKCKRLQIF